MTKFIKLTNYMINTRYITEIIMSADQYSINMYNPSFGGLIIMGSGFGSASSTEIVFNKNKHPVDYEIIDKWIKEQ